MAAARGFQVNYVNRHTDKKDASWLKDATSKLHAIQRLWSPGKPAFHGFCAHEQIIHALCYL